MKLTKEVIEVLKYHGYTTITAPAEEILKVYDTVEDFGYAGYIGDRGAIDFLKTLFDDGGVNRVGETVEEDPGPEFDGAGFTEADNIPPVIEEPIVESEPVVEETSVEEPVEPVVEETSIEEPVEPVVKETSVEEPVTEPEPEVKTVDDSPSPEDLKKLTDQLNNVTVVNVESLPETATEGGVPETPSEEPVEEVKPKPKKTTTKKTTKKES